MLFSLHCTCMQLYKTIHSKGCMTSDSQNWVTVLHLHIPDCTINSLFRQALQFTMFQTAQRLGIQEKLISILTLANKKVLPLKDSFALIIHLSQRQALLQSWIVGPDAGVTGWSYTAEVIHKLNLLPPLALNILIYSTSSLYSIHLSLQQGK